MKQILLSLLLCSSILAQVKVSELPSAGSITGAESVMVVQSATSRKTTVDDLATFARTGYLSTSTAASTYATKAEAASSVWIGASEIVPRTTNGAGVNSSETITHKKNFDTLDFDAGATSESGDFTITLPDNYSGGTITALFFWTADSGSGTVIWRIQGRSLEDGTAIDTAAGTAQSTTDTFQAAGAMHISPATAAVTIAGTPAARTPITFTVSRDSASDSLAVDARLIGIEINYQP